MKNRILVALCIVVLLGCSRAPVSEPVAQSRVGDFEEGGTGNADRDKAEEYFAALKKVQSAEEEAKLLREFGVWLEEKGVKIQVEVKEGKHFLSCPFFPPVTPWAQHAFFDIENLGLLPRLESDM